MIPTLLRPVFALVRAVLLLVLMLTAGCSGTLAPMAPSSSTSAPDAPDAPARVTVLYDAFGQRADLRKDWGYAALVEVRGKRILFDTGNDAATLAHNAKAAGIDLRQLDFVVMSHRHGDHMGGLAHVLRVNPSVTIYAPKENFGVYGSELSSGFYRKAPSLPPQQRYFDGAPPETMHFGAAWPGAKFRLVDQTTEIAPGIHLIALVSDKPGTMELKELSLAIDTPQGMLLVVGCSHPGIDRIVDAAAKINPRIHFIAGGLHLVVANDTEIERIVGVLRDRHHVAYIAPGHCTGEPSFAALAQAFGDHDLYAGLGMRFIVDAAPRAAGVEPAHRGFDAADLAGYRQLALRHDDHEDDEPRSAKRGELASMW